MVLCIYYVHRALDGRYFKWLPGARVKCWMRLTLYKLPQLAVSAKILCLLMVVICGAVPHMVRSMRLYSECSRRYLEIYPNGTVMAKGEDNRQDPKQDLRTSSSGFDMKLLISAPRLGMYLCFNKQWKLVGLNISREQALQRERCQFYENLTMLGFNMFRSAVKANTQRTHFMGFNQEGEQRRGRFHQKCKKFMKKEDGYSIAEHNRKVAGALADIPSPYYANAKPMHIPKNKPQRRPKAHMPQKQRHAHRHAGSRHRSSFEKYGKV